jgi:hypothetical protein
MDNRYFGDSGQKLKPTKPARESKNPRSKKNVVLLDIITKYIGNKREGMI